MSGCLACQAACQITLLVMQGTLHTAKELQLLKAKAARQVAARKANQPHESPDRLEKQTGRLIAVGERAARAAKAAQLRTNVNKGQVSSSRMILGRLVCEAACHIRPLGFSGRLACQAACHIRSLCV